MNARGRELAGAALCVTLVTILVTWPQARLLGSHLAAHHDAQFSIWRLGWIAHALSTQPLRLFDANIFHPALKTLAYSDATLLEGVLGAPLFWLGVSPTAVYNALLLVGFAGSGLGMFVLARRLTGDTAPALLAAIIFTVLPYRIEHFMHLELQWAMFIPLTFWALHETVERASWRWGLAAGVCIWLQLLACVYYGVFLGLTLLVFVPFVLASATRPTRAAAAVAVAACTALVLSVPFLLPYASASGELGTRSPEEIARYSATAKNYFSVSARNIVWSWTSERWGAPELRLFPGATAVVLALVALWRRPVKPVLLYLVVAALAVELSFGPNGFLYGVLFGHVQALQGFRALSRYGAIASCAVAMLAAFGLQAVLRRCTTAGLRATASVLVIAISLVEGLNHEMWIAPADSWAIPDVYRVIRSAAPGAIVELPMPDLRRLPGLDPQYEAWSLWHWRPMVNGYSGYHPQDYLDTLLRMLSFPDEASLGRLRSHDVRYVIVHRSYYDQDTYADLMIRIARRPELKPWGAYRDVKGTADIFELLPVD